MWCESTPRAASWKPTLIASSGTLKSFQDLVRPARTSVERPLEAVQPDQRRVRLVVGAGPIALDRVRLLRDLPLDLHLGLSSRVRGSTIWMLCPVAFA